MATVARFVANALLPVLEVCLAAIAGADNKPSSEAKSNTQLDFEKRAFGIGVIMKSVKYLAKKLGQGYHGFDKSCRAKHPVVVSVEPKKGR